MRLTYASQKIRNKARDSPNLSSARRSLPLTEGKRIQMKFKSRQVNITQIHPPIVPQVVPLLDRSLSFSFFSSLSATPPISASPFFSSGCHLLQNGCPSGGRERAGRCGGSGTSLRLLLQLRQQHRLLTRFSREGGKSLGEPN